MRTHKDFNFEEVYNDVVSTDEYLYLENEKDESESTHTIINIEEVREKANVYRKLHSPVFIINKLNLIYKDISSILFFNDHNSFMSNICLYIKNIKINSSYTKQKKVQFLGISEININIKDNNIIPDLARKNLTSDSNKLFKYTIYKIIHEYALENFDLTQDEKTLLKKFIDTYYSEDSILLNKII
jgi:hypothetical protein